MESTLYLILSPLLMMVYTMAATLDMCLCALNSVELKKLAIGEERKNLDNIVHFLEVHQDVSIALHLSRQILLILTVMTTVLAMVSKSVPHPYLTSLGALIILILVFGQVIPRTFAYRFPEKSILLLAPLFARFYVLLWPFIYPLRKLKLVWTREKGEQQGASDEEIAAFIKVGKEEGILEEGEEKLFKSVVDFGDTVVREVMTPRIDIVAVRDDATVAELRRVVIEEKHSRIPVYTSAMDNLCGFVLARDLVHMLAVPEPATNVRPLLRQPYFVPETKKVSELLSEFQKLRLSMAVVVNEYGGVAGLVTIEDLLEEIVGEIKDEYDEDREQIVRDGSRGYLVAGSMELAKVGEFFQVDLREHEGGVNTIGGLVTALAGRMLAEGESIEHDGLRFEVVQGDRRRIHRIRIKKIMET